MEVVHCKVDPDHVYVGRPTKWGNLWSHKENTEAEFLVSSRKIAVRNYRNWLRGTAFEDVYPERREWILRNLRTLKGKKLGCWCAPRQCHADILLELVNEL